ncbi:hypothetical protein TWF718_007351 [Orbilia javanica]|uniref:AAA+ ATPase domain-containing protein n=1 Tax=Orbilia javanica TaxID=47235 RepID=A0AAN8MTF4_9PEZI
MVASYKLPESFLVNNVKLLADLDKSPTTFKIVDETAQKSANYGTSSKKTNEASRSPSPTPHEDPFWSMPSSDYLEIREAAISGLMVDARGRFDYKYPGLLFDVKADIANTYGKNWTLHLCKDLRANYMEFNFEDLDKLGLEFGRQHKAERERREEEKRIEEEKRREEEERKKAEGETEKTEEENKKTEEEEEEAGRATVELEGPKDGGSGEAGAIEGGKVDEDNDESEEDDQVDDDDEDDGEPDFKNDKEGHFAEYYFGAPKPDGGRKDKQKTRRNKKALNALFDTAISEAGNADEALKKQCNGKTPLIVFIYGIEKMFAMNRGWRFLSRFRDAIQERRRAGVPIFSIFFWLGHSSCSDSKAKKKTGIAQINYLSDSITNCRQWRENEVIINREYNMNTLKDTIRERYSYMVDENVVGKEVEWKMEGMENADSIMNRGFMDQNEVDRIVKSIATRSWGNPKIELSDILWVLNKHESERIAKDEGEEGSKEKKKPSLTSDEKDLYKYVIKPGESPITYDDVIMDPVTKATVRQFVALSKLKVNNDRSSLFSYFKMPGILLFGPPGTGKTHLCRAIANDTGHSFIALSAAELNGRCVGETEKAISAMFSLARKLHPCILFLDEVDSLFYRRGRNDKSWERSALAQYLQEMDGLAAENTSTKAPLVIVATNRPADLDEAFLRRLPYRVFLNMPTYDERRQILERMVPPEYLAEDVNFEDIAKRTDGYSGSDLRTLCGQAALAWATELEVSTGESFQGQKIVLNMKNFELAFSRTGPSASAELIESLEKFNKRFQR